MAHGFPDQMTAVRVRAHGGAGVREVVRVSVPMPNAGEVLVEVRAVARNNTDLNRQVHGVTGSPLSDAQLRALPTGTAPPWA